MRLINLGASVFMGLLLLGSDFIKGTVVLGVKIGLF